MLTACMAIFIEEVPIVTDTLIASLSVDTMRVAVHAHHNTTITFINVWKNAERKAKLKNILAFANCSFLTSEFDSYSDA